MARKHRLLVLAMVATAVFLSQGAFLNEDKEASQVGDFIFFNF